MYFVPYLYGGRSAPYNYNTKYTSLLRVFPESVSVGFSLSTLTAGEKLRHRLTCVPVGLHSLIRILASLRCAARGANPYATDRFRVAAGPTVKHPRNNWPILRWDQRSFSWFMLDRQEESGQGVSFGTMETNFRDKLHECNQNHRFGLHSVN